MADHERLQDPAFAPAIDKWTTEELLTAARAVEALVQTPGWGVIQRLLEERERELLDAIVEGSIRDVEEYVATTRRCAGMRSARQAAQAILELAARKQRELARQEEQRKAEGDS